MSRKSFLVFLCILSLSLFSCRSSREKIEPKMQYVLHENYTKSLPSPFEPLSSYESEQGWGKEYQIGLAFGKQVDLYQAITAFKRAEILIPKEDKERKLEIQYYILFSYFLGEKWQDVAYTFEHSDLPYTDPHFPAYGDLLLIMFDTYQKLGQDNKVQKTYRLLEQNYPEKAKKLTISSSLQEGDIDTVKELSKQYPQETYLQEIATQYELEKKSVGKAQLFNALMPGAGYLYLGQKQSAFTAFLLNGLFIAAAYEFFHRGYTAAGIILTSFEAGWYFGGIYGAGESGKLYNERVYERITSPVMQREKLFPIFMIQYAF